MKHLQRIAQMIFDTPLAIQQSKLEAILNVLGPRLGIEIPLEANGDDDWDEAERKNYRVTEDGIACIPIQGTLMKKSRGLWALSGCSSYEKIGGQMQECVADPEVLAILLDIDSPGGETHGCFELSDLIYSLRGQKPIYAIANDAAMSAAYAIASAADEVFVTRTGGVGSIGVYALHVDSSGADETAGLRFSYIYAGDKKIDGNPHEKLSSSARKDAQAEVDREYDIFCRTVARNRGVALAKITGTEAGVSFADGAIPMLADKVGTFEDAMAALLEEIDTGEFMPAIPPHKTATVKKAWDGPAAKANLKNDGDRAYYRKAYAWEDSEGDGTTKADFKFIHHEVSGDGAVGAANITACSTGIGVLNGGRGGTVIPAGDRNGVHAHLAKHMKDAGEEPPELKSLAAIAAESESEMARIDDDPLAIAGKKGDADYMDDGKKSEGKKAEPKDDDDADEKDDEKDDEKGKKSTSKKPAKKAKKAESEKEGDEDDDDKDGKDDDDDDEKKDEAKKATSDAVRIANLCMLAGQDKLAAKFISRGYTVKQVTAKLLELRSKASAETDGVQPDFGTASTGTGDPMQAIDQQARTLSRNKGISLAKAYLQVCEANPQLYQDYTESVEEATLTRKSRREYVAKLQDYLRAQGRGTTQHVQQDNLPR